jgi:hypothetical protein
MSTVGLFIAGAAVTMIVATALGLLVWAAILDGREQQEREAAEKLEPRPGPSGTKLEPVAGSRVLEGRVSNGGGVPIRLVEDRR